jgi:predicted solute-binding protein
MKPTGDRGAPSEDGSPFRKYHVRAKRPVSQGASIDWNLRVSAVSYLNTWPLVWGFLNGPGRGLYDFRFDLPAQCADALGAGEVDMGLVPCAELDRLGLDFLPDLGIACDGPVRSILLISKKPFGQIRTLAADSSSRTSVALTRILLAERFGCRPAITRQPPQLEEMLAESDAALIIGDPALRIEPAELPWETLDLGAEWVKWSGLPMVFAVWAGRTEVLGPDVARAFADSWEWGRAHMDEIVARAAAERGFSEAVAREYLTRHIVFELTPRHRAGLALFREKVRELA